MQEALGAQRSAMADALAAGHKWDTATEIALDKDDFGDAMRGAFTELLSLCQRRSAASSSSAAFVSSASS